MPTKADHVAQAAHNEALADRLATLEEFGWAITCLFYAALHLVEAHLRDIGHASRNHARRDWELRELPSLQPIYMRYRALKTESENSRYDCRVFSRRDFDGTRDMIYRPLASHVRNLVTA